MHLGFRQDAYVIFWMQIGQFHVHVYYIHLAWGMLLYRNDFFIYTNFANSNDTWMLKNLDYG